MLCGAQSAVEETSGAKLVSAGLTGIKDALKKLDEGGVLFIDVSDIGVGKIVAHCAGESLSVEHRSRPLL
jgi:hypothetical protein